MKGLISEIQRSSVHDGPGMRTVVFLKGCNMRCVWCHNPETIHNQVETLFSPDKCIGCGECDRGCFGGAKVKSGIYMDTGQVLDAVKQDKPYYGSRGGVTISGGEPLCQSGFVTELLTACRKAGIHTAIETNLSADTDTVLTVCGQTDMIMCDCKLYEDDRHISYTGISNTRILKNLHEIDRLHIPILVRTPVIGGVNDKEETIGKIAEHIAAMKNLLGYELLTYHPLGMDKPVSAHFAPQRFNKPDKQVMQLLGRTAQSKGIKVLIDNAVMQEESEENADI